VAAEVSVNHRNGQLRRERNRCKHTVEAILDLTAARAAVAIIRVPVVASLVRARENHCVAARGHAHARGTIRLVLAVRVASVERCHIAVVALLRPLTDIVTTVGRLAVLAGGVALEAVLELALVGTPRGSRTTIVALFETGDDPIAALGSNARDTGKRAGPSVLARAGRAASITARRVPVVASLRWVDA